MEKLKSLKELHGDYIISDVETIKKEKRIGQNFMDNINLLTKIQKAVCRKYNIQQTELDQKNITAKCIDIRQKIIYLYNLGRIDKGFTNNTICIWYAGMSNANVNNAIQIVQDRMESNEEYKKDIEALKSNL